MNTKDHDLIAFQHWGATPQREDQPMIRPLGAPRQHVPTSLDNGQPRSHVPYFRPMIQERQRWPRGFGYLVTSTVVALGGFLWYLWTL